MKTKTISVGLLFILFMCFLFQLTWLTSFPSAETKPNLSAIQEEDISINWGDNLIVGYPYTYAGTFWDDTNPVLIWSTSEIQFQYIPNPTEVNYSHAITGFENYESENPMNSSITMIEGTHIQNGTFDSLDNDYHIFGASEGGIVVPEQPGDFDIIYGSLSSEGDLKFIDSDYSVFDSEAIDVGTNYYDQILRPDGDVITEWTGGVGLPHWEELAEETPDSQVVKSTGAQDEEQDYETTDIGGGTIYRLEVWGYISKLSSGNPNIYYRIGTGGYSSGKTMSVGTSMSWCSVYWDGLSLSQSDLDDIRIKWEDLDGGWLYLDICHINVSWSETNYDYATNFTTTINIDEISDKSDINLVYSYKTNISQLCNFSIYNFDNLEYDSIASSISEAFNNCYFQLNSSYYNATNDLIVEFDLYNLTDSFQLQLERLGVRMTSFLNFTTYVHLTHLTDLLYLNISSYQRSNISQLINLYAWDWDDDAWDLLDSQTYITTFQLSTYSSSTVFQEYIHDTTGQILISYYGMNRTDDFQFEVDELEFECYRKTVMQYEKTLYLLGVWKYRFVLDEGLGTEHIQDWVYFNIIQSVPNFYAISESDYTTRWILQGADISPVINFTDDITGSNWDLDGVSNRFFDSNSIATGDSYIDSYSPTLNHGSATSLFTMYYYDMDMKLRSYYAFTNINSTGYLYNNESGNYKVGLYASGIFNPNEYTLQFYTTSSFVENTINWNNAPAPDVLKDSYIPSTTPEWKYFNVSSLSNMYFMTKWSSETGSDLRTFEHNSREATYKPKFIRFNVSKNYFGNGYMYMQTNVSETIALKSTDYETHYTLSSGDYFEVELQTSSDSLINLILYKDGIVNKTLTLSQTGNNNFNRRTVQISVGEDVEFDQLKISSTFEDTDNMRVYNIKTFKYTLTGDYEDFYVSPKNQRDVYLIPDTYNLRIFEESILKIDTNVSLIESGIYYVYKPIKVIQCRITLFSLEGEYLQFEDYHISVNRSFNGEYNQFWLVDTLFYTDEETYIYIEVYDRFDALIDTFSKLASSYIDLELEVYQLQIKSLLAEKTTLDINSTHIYPLLSQETISFWLAKDYYQIGYYDEQGDYNQFIIYLNENKAYELNSTYFQVYFSLFNFDGLGLEPYLFRFYINGLRKDFGFNILKQDVNNIKVLDYFNATLFNQNLNLRGYTEYSIYVEVWTMILRNNYSFPVKIKIERNNIEVEQVIESGLKFTIRMLPKVVYEIKVYHLNGTLLETREIELEENNQIESFGFYSEEVPKYPDLSVSALLLTIILIVLGFIGFIVFIGYFVWKYYQRTKKLKRAYIQQQNIDMEVIRNFSGGKRIK